MQTGEKSNDLEKIDSRELFRHPRITIHEDTVKLPSGVVIDYIHFGEGKDIAMILAQNKDGKFLLQSEYSYPIGESLLQFPGGAIEEGESPEMGAVREFAEEAGLAGDLEKIGSFYVDNRRKSSRIHVFHAVNLTEAKAEKDIEEEFEDFWYTEAEISKLIRDDKITNYSALAGWAIYTSKRH